jgi:hypothetical protein
MVPALGHAIRIFGLSIVACIVALMLAPQIEGAVLSHITGGDAALLPYHPIALSLLGLSVISIVGPGPRRRRLERAFAAPGQG